MVVSCIAWSNYQLTWIIRIRSSSHVKCPFLVAAIVSDQTIEAICYTTSAVHISNLRSGWQWRCLDYYFVLFWRIVQLLTVAEEKYLNWGNPIETLHCLFKLWDAFIICDNSNFCSSTFCLNILELYRNFRFENRWEHMGFFIFLISFQRSFFGKFIIWLWAKFI